jgi:MoaA/NifB/PqqE/SkfB family radical SAM enzyme
VLNLVTESRMHELPNLGEVDPQTYHMDQLEYPRIDRKLLGEALDKTMAEAQRVGIELRMPRMPMGNLLDYYDGHMNLKEFECRNAWNTLVIGRQGDAFPCWIRKIGNVRENSIKELWNSALMRDFRQTCQKQLFAPCPGCCFLQHKGEAVAKQTAPAAAESLG